MIIEGYTKHPSGRVVPKSLGKPNDASLVLQKINSRNKFGSPKVIPSNRYKK
jgi:hypothetical protein